VSSGSDDHGGGGGGGSSSSSSSNSSSSAVASAVVLVHRLERLTIHNLLPVLFPTSHCVGFFELLFREMLFLRAVARDSEVCHGCCLSSFALVRRMRRGRSQHVLVSLISCLRCFRRLSHCTAFAFRAIQLRLYLRKESSI